MFSAPPRHVEKSTAEDIGTFSYLSLSAGNDDESHDIYQERLESRAREVIFARAEALASVDVARLCSGYDLAPTLRCHPVQTRYNHGPTLSIRSASYAVVASSDMYKNSLSSKLEVKPVANVSSLEGVGNSLPLDQVNRNDIASLDSVLRATEDFHHEENITREDVRKSVQAQTSSGSFWSWWS